MHGNFCSIGFGAEPDHTFRSRIENLANTTRERLAVAMGDYVIWRSHSGAELWFHVPGERQADGELAPDGIIGVAAYFESDAAARVRLVRTICRPEHTPFEGAFAGWVTPSDGGEAPPQPIVFDAIDFAAHSTRTMPLACTVKLAGFVRALMLFRDEAAFRAGGADTKGMEPRSFHATGLKAAGAKGPALASKRLPSAHALVNGVVLDHRRLRNEETVLDFHVVTLDCNGLTLDIVASARHIHGQLEPGQIVQALCSLVGRVLEDH